MSAIVRYTNEYRDANFRQSSGRIIEPSLKKKKKKKNYPTCHGRKKYYCQYNRENRE